MLKRTIVWIISLAASLNVLAITPEEVMAKAVSKIESAPGIAGRYTAGGDLGSASGSFRFDGRRAFMESPQGGKSWYDGRNLWTLNPRTKEVTISIPDREELMAVNPMLYVTGYRQGYRLFFSKKTDPGKYLVLLNPKKGGTGIKAIEIGINKGNFMPEHILVRDESDRRTLINLRNLSYTRKFMNSDFTFPAAKYKGYETVDLR